MKVGIAIMAALALAGCKSKDVAKASGGSDVTAGATAGAAGSGSAVAVASGSGSGSGSGSDVAPSAEVGLFDEGHHAAFSAKEHRVAYMLGRAEEGNDTFTDIVVADLTGKELEHPELPGKSSDDYQAKLDELQRQLAARGFVTMAQIAWSEDAAAPLIAGGHTFAFTNKNTSASVTVDGAPFAKFEGAATHTPSPTAVAWVPGTRVAFVEIWQDAGSGYGEGYSNFGMGQVAELPAAAAPFTP
jgi:hypothetical protein